MTARWHHLINSLNSSVWSAVWIVAFIWTLEFVHYYLLFIRSGAFYFDPRHYFASLRQRGAAITDEQINGAADPGRKQQLEWLRNYCAKMTDEQIDEAGDFSPHYSRYQDLSKLAVAFSAGAIAFVVNALLSRKPEDSGLLIAKLAGVAPITIGFFGAAIALLFVFMALLTVWYEEYCHTPDHSSYRAWKYAMINSLGVTGILACVFGFVWLAAHLFT